MIGRMFLVVAVAALVVALPQANALASDETDSRLARLLERNPRGHQIVEQMAREGVEAAAIVLCRAGIGGAAEESGVPGLYWCSRAAYLGQPSALRELGTRLLASDAKSDRAEGLRLMVLSELVGDSLAILEVPLLPDFFDVTPRQIARARRDALGRVERGAFHDAASLGFRFDLSAAEQTALTRRRLQALQRTAALGELESGLARQLAARRRQLERGALVDLEARRTHQARLEAKDELQARLSDDFKRASREDDSPGSARDLRARADRRERLSVGARLHTDRTDRKGQLEIERTLEVLLEKINGHRTPTAALTLDDLGLPWRGHDDAAASARDAGDGGGPR